MSIISNIRKRGFKDILDFSRVKLYLTAKFNKKRKYIKVPYDNIDSFCEQYIYRKTLCAGCFAKNDCMVCGCKAREIMSEPTGTCSAGEWFEMKDNKEWAKEKDYFKITIGVNFKDNV